MERGTFLALGIRWRDEDARVIGGRGSVLVRASAPRAVVLGRRVSSGARRPRSKNEGGDRERGFVRGSCCAAQAGRRCLTGDRRGARAPSVKPSSRGSEGSKAKSIGSSSGVERRRFRKHLFGGLVGGGVPVRDEASPSRGGVFKRAWPKRRKGSRKGAPHEAEATGRQRFGRKRAETGVERGSTATTGPPKRGVSP